MVCGPWCLPVFAVAAAGDVLRTDLSSGGGSPPAPVGGGHRENHTVGLRGEVVRWSGCSCHHRVLHHPAGVEGGGLLVGVEFAFNKFLPSIFFAFFAP